MFYFKGVYYNINQLKFLVNTCSLLQRFWLVFLHESVKPAQNLTLPHNVFAIPKGLLHLIEETGRKVAFEWCKVEDRVVLSFFFQLIHHSLFQFVDNTHFRQDSLISFEAVKSSTYKYLQLIIRPLNLSRNTIVVLKKQHQTEVYLVVSSLVLHPNHGAIVYHPNVEHFFKLYLLLVGKICPFSQNLEVFGWIKHPAIVLLTCQENFIEITFFNIFIFLQERL